VCPGVIETPHFGTNPRALRHHVVYPSAVDDESPIIDLQSDAYFMGQALREARKAYAAGEVPCGAVVVKEGRIISRAWNQVETLKDATAHAEMLALTAAQQSVGDWRLEKCTLYVTKEPCPMCAGAIVHCRPERVVFGVSDPKGGAAGGWINLLESNPPLNHRCDVTSGVLGEECLYLLQSFFREARERKKLERGAEVAEQGD
jgi:tRNA(adenine34) deaminase